MRPTLKIRSQQIAAGITFVLENHAAIYLFIIKHISDILFAAFHLVADIFTLTGELGFSGVYGNLFFIFTHILFVAFFFMTNNTDE